MTGLDRRDRKRLNELLVELMSAQDEATYINKQGPEMVELARELISKRDAIRRKIVAFVEMLATWPPRSIREGD